MIKWFKMLNGELMETQTVIDEGLLIDRYPTPYLRQCIDEREWTGRPSVTQCLNGTRLEYLRILTDFAVDPDDAAFRIVGTRGHGRLEDKAGKDDFAEVKFAGDITGMADLLEPDSAAPGEHILTDYKVWGSFRIKRMRPVVERTRPLLDEHGEPVLYKRAGKYGGPGDPKQEVYYIPDPDSRRDLMDADWQVNKYRQLAEEHLGVKISRMRIFVPVRDGGMRAARDNGVDTKTVMIDVLPIDDEKVTEYFDRKAKALGGAMQGYAISIAAGHDDVKALVDNMPDACTKEEAWDGRRCQDFCDVADACVAAGCPYLSRHTEGE